MRAVLVAALFLSLYCLLPAGARAAELRGSVVDAQGRPVPRAQVIIEGNIIGGAKVALSGSSGEFYFWGLPPGDYLVTVTPPSGSGLPKRRVRVDQGANTVNFSLGRP